MFLKPLFIFVGIILGIKAELTPLQQANIVKEQFVYAYNAYKEFALGYDSLNPISKTGDTLYDYSLLFTPVDAIDTMYLMGLNDLLNETLAYICTNLTFNIDMSVHTFDIIIRSIGGLLSGYYFTKEECLLKLAVDAADRIMPTFENPSPSGFPWRSINLASKEIYEDDNSNPAEIGSSILEMGVLSYLTGDNKYFEASKNAMKLLYQSNSPVTNMVGACINLRNEWNVNVYDSRYYNLWCDNRTYIDGGIDSYIEYELKCWKLFNDKDCYNWWKSSNESIINYLSYYNGNNSQLWFKRMDIFDTNNVVQYEYGYDYYAAYFAGVLTLGIENNDEYQLKLAKLNQEANYAMWLNTGIETELFDFANMESLKPDYQLNPENFESNYYLWVHTNDDLYYQRAVHYINDLMKYCRCAINQHDCAGYSGLTDVQNNIRSNSLPSWFFAESLKYLYLTFIKNEESNPFNFDDFVFTTEAHPLPKIWGNIV